MMQNKSIGIIPFLLLGMILFHNLEASCISADKGKLDLTTWDGESAISLDGNWLFFWNRYIEPDEAFDIEANEDGMFVRVPNYWTEYNTDGDRFPGKGYASYALQILLPENYKDDLAFDIPVFDDSYSLFINGQKQVSCGKPGTNIDDSEAEYGIKTLVYTPDSTVLNVLIHVANFHHRRGGFWKSMRLGSSEKIIHQNNTYELIVHLTLGLLVAFSLLFFFFFVFYTKNKVALFFALTLAGLLVRFGATDTFPVLEFWDLSWDCLIRLEYLGSFISFGFSTWYFLQLYPNKLIKKVVMLNSVLIALICVVILIVEPADFAYTMFYFKPAVILFFLYYLVISFINIFRREAADEYYFGAILIFLLAMVNDILISGSSTAIFNDYIIHFAVQLIIFVNVILLIRTWIEAYKEKIHLNVEIEYLNLNLEKKIEERTKELKSGKNEIENQHNEIKAKNEELKSVLDFNNKIQSIIAHDLKSPITSLFQISDYLYLSYGKGELAETIQSIRELSASANYLVDNLLSWSRSQQGKLLVTPYNINLKALMRDLMMFYKSGIKQKSLKYDVLIDDNLKVFSDLHHIRLVISNLLSNAIKYSKKGGMINISAARIEKNKRVVLIIEDKGIGMPTELLDTLIKLEGKSLVESRKGTLNEKGSGLGIPLCQELVKLNNGKLVIESKVGKGTKIRVYLPIGE